MVTGCKRYAVVGTGGRSAMFIDAIAGAYRAHARLVGFCDASPTRMAVHNRRLRDEFGISRPVPTYPPEAFAAMVEQQRPDVVIVTTPDATHHRYVIRAMELGCDVICEKPMTTDADKARAIFNAVERTGRDLRVTFNFRYAPHVTLVRDLIMRGVIGRPLAADLRWVLDSRHGADYFRRWHATKANSGGLLVHKATHHFDIINWWIDARPQTVFAMGDLKFYGRKNAQARGETYSYDRYTGAPEAKGDPFALTLDDNEQMRGLYLDAEQDSGYIRDRNVFGDHIDIEDTMAVMVRYHNQVILNYSLVAYSPWEGFRAAITGTKGRVELYDKHGSHIIDPAGSNGRGIEPTDVPNPVLRVFPMFGKPYQVDVPKLEGSHGGSDPLLMEQLFSPTPPPDPHGRQASHIDGAASALIGICANASIASGRPIVCDEVLRLQESPTVAC